MSSHSFSFIILSQFSLYLLKYSPNFCHVSLFLCTSCYLPNSYFWIDIPKSLDPEFLPSAFSFRHISKCGSIPPPFCIWGKFQFPHFSSYPSNRNVRTNVKKLGNAATPFRNTGPNTCTTNTRRLTWNPYWSQRATGSLQQVRWLTHSSPPPQRKEHCAHNQGCPTIIGAQKNCNLCSATNVIYRLQTRPLQRTFQRTDTDLYPIP
jgi:hypothetical protein